MGGQRERQVQHGVSVQPHGAVEQEHGCGLRHPDLQEGAERVAEEAGGQRLERAVHGESRQAPFGLDLRQRRPVPGPVGEGAGDDVFSHAGNAVHLSGTGNRHDECAV
ncbi:hypothetical protein D3C71_1595280 [compost metagenome]